MKFDNLNHDKGVAGLTIFLSLIVMLFIIGLLISIFVIMGGELKDSDSVKASESATVTDEEFVVDDSTNLPTCILATEGSVTSIVVTNSTGIVLDTANYTYSGCVLSIVTPHVQFNASEVNATYTYTYAGAGYYVINDTSTSLGTVTDWYPIFIVIGAMVVLILLTVIIITAIRGSGMVGDTMGGSGGNVGLG